MYPCIRCTGNIEKKIKIALMIFQSFFGGSVMDLDGGYITIEFAIKNSIDSLTQTNFLRIFVEFSISIIFVCWEGAWEPARKL